MAGPAIVLFDQCVLCAGVVSRVRRDEGFHLRILEPCAERWGGFIGQSFPPRGSKPFPPLAHGLIGDPQFDLDRPRQMQLIFDRGLTKSTPGPFRTRVAQVNHLGTRWNLRFRIDAANLLAKDHN